MAQQLFANNATTTLAAPMVPGSTSLSVTSGSGALFPAPTGGNWFIATLVAASNPTIREIVKVTGAGTDAFTVVRAQEGTSALSWSAGDTFALLTTAGTLATLLQPGALQTSSANYAQDTGAVNVYQIALTPPITSYSIGVPLRFKASNTNTGPCSLDAGGGPLALVAPSFGISGGVLPPGTIVSGGIYTVAYDGVRFQLLANTGMRGQFVPTPTGFASSSFTGQYTFVEGLVCLTITGSGVSGGLSANQFALTNVPNFLWPATDKNVACAGLVNGGALCPSGAVKITATGVLEFAPDGTLITFGWATSGTKGMNPETTFTYQV